MDIDEEVFYAKLADNDPLYDEYTPDDESSLHFLNDASEYGELSKVIIDRCMESQ